MSMLNEAILINYKHKTEYNNIALNAIGVTTSNTLRTQVTYNVLDCKYVKKFGTHFTATGCSAIANPPAHLTATVKALDGTILGSRTNGGAFVPGATVTAQGIYIEFSHDGTAGTTPATLAITLTGHGAVTIYLTGESVGPAPGNSTVKFYCSTTGSTYYDTDLKYGGYRLSGNGTPSRPFYNMYSAISALGGLFTKICVMDSESYDITYGEIYLGANPALDFDVVSTFCQAALGQTPRITRGTGARASREVMHDGNNIDTIYVSKAGSDSGNGTYQSPYLTIGKASSMIGSPKIYINIMDSETYISNWTSLSGKTHIEPLYGKLPVIFNLVLYVSDWLYCSGIIFDGAFSNDTFTIISGLHMDISDCTIKNCYRGIYWYNATAGNDFICNRNLFINNRIPFFSESASASSLIMTGNIARDCGRGFWFQAGATHTLTLNISDNEIYGITEPESNFGVPLLQNGNGITLLSYGNTPVYAGTINNNTIYDCIGAGIYLYRSGSISFTVSATITNNILSNCAYYGIYSTIAKTVSYNSFFENGTNTNANITNNNAITADPQLIDPIYLKKFGIGSESPCYRTGSGGDDIGARRRIIEINTSNITINGFYIDGQESINNSVFILDTVNHTGTNILWCDIFDFSGIAVDPYDDNTNLTMTISNCKLYRNGDGVRLPFGGNVVSYCEIYNNVKNGIYNNDDINITNCIFYGNYIGLNSGTLGVGIIKNSVFSNNFYRGIYSVANSYDITYDNITDDVGNLDISDVSNLNVNSMFVNLDAGTEDFHIQTIEAGYLINSGLKDAGDDGYDIGAYKLSRSMLSDCWRAHELNYNPRNIDFQSSAIGLNSLINGIGGLDTFTKDNKLSFVFKWNSRQYSDETDRKKIQYLHRLLKRRVVETPDSETIIRLTFLKTQNLANGTGTIDAVAKTIMDASADYVEEEWRGFFIGVKYLTGIATGTISASGKTLAVCVFPGWTTNQWTGYYFRYDKYWYYILSNTVDTLTLSDPDDTLVDASGINWSIEKYFKCADCYQDEITVIDDDDELPSGSYAYYIGFIEVRVEKPGMTYTQARYFFQQENWKTGYSIEFQEV